MEEQDEIVQRANALIKAHEHRTNVVMCVIFAINAGVSCVLAMVSGNWIFLLNMYLSGFVYSRYFWKAMKDK